MAIIAPTTTDILRATLRIEGRMLSLQAAYSTFEESMSKQVDDLRREVQEARDVMTGAATSITESTTRISDLVEQLRNAPQDAAQVEALAQELSDETDKLKAAMTPLQDPTPPEPVPPAPVEPPAEPTA